MSCLSPLTGWRAICGKNENGKWPVVFDISKGFRDMPVVVPCGQCIGCRLDKAKDWAGRCIQESKLWDSNYFLTLTYDDALTPVHDYGVGFDPKRHRPSDGSLMPYHLQLFWKRLRKWVFSKAPSEAKIAAFRRSSSAISPYRSGLGREPVYELVDGKKTLVNGVRYFAAGEYGSQTQRPHYHAIVFNLEIPDLIPAGRGANGDPLWVSNILNDIWGHGRVIVGAVTFESAGYVARYTTKKIYGAKSDEVYGSRIEPFSRSSNRPGVGANWFIKYADEVSRVGFVLINGHRNPVPRYYLNKMEKMNKDDYLTYKKKRDRIMLRSKDSPDRQEARLAQRKEFLEYSSTRLHRGFGG